MILTTILAASMVLNISAPLNTNRQGEGLVLVENKSVPRDLGENTAKVISLSTKEKVGTIIISNSGRTLDVVQPNGKALRYRISVGRDGFTWKGVVTVGAKSKWPEWRPPAEMRRRDPSLPQMVPSGPYNPLGARALYLYANGKDTLYRIHGTNTAESVGSYETSGCFRLTNTDVIQLFEKIPVGTKVIVQ
ncbi:L,D-transpeptidase [Thioclava sp. FR2]|uniref:L,D-transpeptidase n=1 Tax=Thioclava sp. FR2 TaxID=3445780 RepID=UPI003EBAE9E3